MGLSLILGWIWCPGCEEKNQGSVCTYKMFLADPAAAQRLVGLYIKLFLAGAKRIAVPGATFYLHSSNRTFNGPQGIAAVEEALSLLKSDNERMATIIAQETSIEKTDMSGIFLHGRTMNADEAKTDGLVHEIRALAMPAGSEVVQVAAAY
jgi:ATP-dependent Clp protease protease subunit